jgi:autotransporter-associated beta strand protein
MNISGAGAAPGTGALENVSGNNSYAGAIKLTSASTISSDSGTLTMNAVNDNGFLLTTAGPGNMAINGVLQGGGGLTAAVSGTLTLAAANTYTGATTVTAGTLIVSGSLTATSGVTVTNATLAGIGLINKSVNVNIGNNLGAAASAIIEAGLVNAVGKLTTGTMALNSDAEYVLNLDTSTASGTASEILANALSLNSGAQFSFNEISATPGVLTIGDVFTVIHTANANGLTGTFGNLTNGEVVQYGANDYQAAYTATNLTLTVVSIPEPVTWGMVFGGFGMLICLQKMRKRRMGI